MGRLFKEWDKKFNKAELALEREKWLYRGSSAEERNGYTCWPNPVTQWPQSQVQLAVYNSITSEEWQRFRVCMKGCTTSEKLYMLHNRLATLCGPSDDDAQLELCRIDNYIGALVRGGQLSNDGKYTVLK